MIGEKVLPLGEFIDALHDAVLFVDSAGSIVFVNCAVSRVFGYEAAELVGQPLAALIPSRHRRSHGALVARFHTRGQPMSMGDRSIVHGVNKQGEEIALSISLCHVELQGERFSVAIVRDASAVHEEIGRALDLAETDALTGIGNRLHFSRRLHADLSVPEHRFALLFLDLVKFKALNDTHGHHVGDEVLHIVAKRLKAKIRDRDTVARLGGDEFVVLLESAEEHARLDERVHAIAEAIAQPMHIGALVVQVGVNIGCAIYPTDGTSERELLEKADHAMYRAKAAGEAVQTHRAA